MNTSLPLFPPRGGLSRETAFAATFPSAFAWTIVPAVNPCPCRNGPTEIELYDATPVPTFSITSTLEVVTTTLPLSALALTTHSSKEKEVAAISGVFPSTVEIFQLGNSHGTRSTYGIQLNYPKALVNELGMRVPIPQVITQCGSKAASLDSALAPGAAANTAVVDTVNALVLPHNAVLEVVFEPFRCYDATVTACCG